MKLLTKALEHRFAQIGCQESAGEDALIVCKFFTPWSNWTWYATEYNTEDRTFFGYVEGHFPEWGYFSLDELETVKGPYGLKVERDLHFAERRAREVIAG